MVGGCWLEEAASPLLIEELKLNIQHGLCLLTASSETKEGKSFNLTSRPACIVSMQTQRPCCTTATGYTLQLVLQEL